MTAIFAAFLAGIATGALIVWLVVSICLRRLFCKASKRHILCRICSKAPKCTLSDVKIPAN